MAVADALVAVTSVTDSPTFPVPVDFTKTVVPELVCVIELTKVTATFPLPDVSALITPGAVPVALIGAPPVS